MYLKPIVLNSLLKKTEVYLKECVRHLSSNQVSAALRPFYFNVHPDLFGRYPTERDTNEDSLKQLNMYIERLLHQKPVRPSRVKFYLKKQNPQEHHFETVNISLAQKDIFGALQSILSSCNLSTEYIDKLPKPLTVQKQQVRNHNSTSANNWCEDLDNLFRGAAKPHEREEDTLKRWLKKYSAEAQERSKLCQPVREEIARLQSELCQKLELKDLIWACGWGTSHFRGCLQSFKTLITHHPQEMKSLKNRTVIFGNESGVSLQGHVILNSGEVRHNWLDLIRNLERYDNHLKRIPALQAALSRSLCEIQIAQRLFRPELLAEAYESHLRSLTTSLGNYRSRNKYPEAWPECLDKFQLVVEGNAGPLMLSPSGQFIAPSSCPISLLVSFITDNMEEARARLDKHGNALEEEKLAIAKCIQKLGLSALGKDDNVTPTQMTSCCNRLLENELWMPKDNQARIWVTHYYSLISDGEMCIPWNWK